MFRFIARVLGFVKTDTFGNHVAIVTTALSDSRYEFRSKTALARKIGTTDPAVLDGVLATIGVRGMYGNPEMVGLISRIGDRPRRRSESF